MFKNFGKKGQPDSQMPSLNPPGGPILDQEMVPVQGAPPVQMSLLPKGGPPQGGNNSNQGGNSIGGFMKGIIGGGGNQEDGMMDERNAGRGGNGANGGGLLDHPGGNHDNEGRPSD